MTMTLANERIPSVVEGGDERARPLPPPRSTEDSAMQPGIGLQMYTLRDEMRNDYVGTLRKVAEIGYPAVQFAGYGGLSAAEMKRLLDELGLKAAGSHVGIEALESHPD